MRTTSSWKKFACCLPKVTPEIVNRSSCENKEEASSSNPDNDMKDIVQYCFDNNSNDITWEKILHACLEADEVAVARKILDDNSGKL